MAEQKITLIINEEGAISAKTEGFKGEACLEGLDEILGSVPILESKKTHEFDEKISSNRKVQVKGSSS